VLFGIFWSGFEVGWARLAGFPAATGAQMSSEHCLAREMFWFPLLTMTTAITKKLIQKIIFIIFKYVPIVAKNVTVEADRTNVIIRQFVCCKYVSFKSLFTERKETIALWTETAEQRNWRSLIKALPQQMFYKLILSFKRTTTSITFIVGLPAKQRNHFFNTNKYLNKANWFKILTYCNEQQLKNEANIFWHLIIL